MISLSMKGFSKLFTVGLCASFVALGTQTHATAVCDNATIPSSECEALVDLYNSTDGENWTNNDNWLQTGNIDEREGVVA